MERTQDQYTDEEIKTFFKLSKKLMQTYGDMRHVTTKFLLKFNKIKARRQENLIQMAEKNKRDQIDKKRREKMEERKARMDKEKAEKQKWAQAERKRKAEEPPPQKSIISIIRPEKIRLKQNKKQNKQKNISEEKPAQDQQQANEQKAVLIEQPKPLQKPVQPLEPYYQFLSSKRNQINSTTANISIMQTSKILKAVWQKMSDEQKRPFIQSYQADRKKYQRDMVAYYEPRRGKAAQAKRKLQQQKSKQKQKKLGGIDFMEELAKM